MQARAARIREHIQDVEFGGIGVGEFCVVGAAEGAILEPILLPAGFDGGGVIVRHEGVPAFDDDKDG